MYWLASAMIAHAGTALAQGMASPECSIADRLPDEAEVHHIGAYAGTSELGAVIELDDSGHDVKKIDVLVNLPGKSIALVLSAYDPVVWNIAWTPGSRIVGAVVSGFHGQAVLGIQRTIPLLLTTSARNKRNDGAGSHCGYFYVYRANDESAKAAETAYIIWRIVGRPVTHFALAPRHGVAVVGEPMTPPAALESSSDYSLKDFVVVRARNEVPAGHHGLEELAKRGVLRHASSDDVRAFEASGVRGIVRGIPTYVVLKPMTMPDGLYGGYSVNILVPEGVPMPAGPRGHNTFFRYGNPRCVGPICGR